VKSDGNSIIDEEQTMASSGTAITIRKLEETVKSKLRVRAAENGRSMEEEAREILKNALNKSAAEPVDLATSVRRRFAAIGVGLPLAERGAVRPAPNFRK
jgi:plasmid stability protein